VSISLIGGLCVEKCQRAIFILNILDTLPHLSEGPAKGADLGKGTRQRHLQAVREWLKEMGVKTLFIEPVALNSGDARLNCPRAVCRSSCCPGRSSGSAKAGVFWLVGRGKESSVPQHRGHQK
jgi:hypothetical protein